MKKSWLVLGFLIIFASVLRIYQLVSLPLYGDELTMVYDSYSLLKTGHDQLGDPLPLTFKMGAGRPAGYVYASIPFVAIFGPTALGVRMLSVLSGLGLIILAYFLGKKLIGGSGGMWSAFLLAISPWDLNLSRGGFEAHFALFLSVLGIWLFLVAKSKPWLMVFSAFCWVFAIFTYPTFKLTLPLILLALLLFQGWRWLLEKKTFKITFLAGVILLGGTILSITQTFTAGSEARFETINIFGQIQLKEEIIQKVNFQRSVVSFPGPFKLWLHNQPLEYGLLIGESYLKNLSFDFLFLHGDKNPRHNMTTMGEFYLADMILIILGAAYLVKNKRKELWLLIAWLLIAPLPTALLLEPHALRNAFMLPPLIILMGAGVSFLGANFRLWQIKLLAILTVVFIGGQFIFLGERLYLLAPKEFGRFWSYPAQEAAQLIGQEKKKYDYIILSDQIDNAEYAYPVYAQVDPSIIISQNKNRTKLGGYDFKKIENIYIGHIPTSEVDRFTKNLNGSALYIGAASEAKELSSYETINGLDGLAAIAIQRIYQK